MKSLKNLFRAFLVAALFCSSFSVTAYSKNSHTANSKSPKDFLVQGSSNHIEYQEIDKVIWVIIYGDDGKEIDRYPME